MFLYRVIDQQDIKDIEIDVAKEYKKFKFDSVLLKRMYRPSKKKIK